MEIIETLELDGQPLKLKLELTIPDAYLKALLGDSNLSEERAKALAAKAFNDITPSPNYLLEVGDFVKWRILATIRQLNELKELMSQKPVDSPTKQADGLTENKQQEKEIPKNE
jgi:hypothetical protein